MARNQLRLFVPILLIVIACAALLFQQVDLTNSDLGRHLENGKILVEGSHDQAQSVLHTNLYSYTAGQYPFVNHHWLAGVVFFLVWKLGSFAGLTIFYAALVALALSVSYWTAQRVANPLIAAALVALIVPIVAWRNEVRPEAFTYLFTALFYCLLLAWSQGGLGNRTLALSLPCLMLLWINLHIGFVFGFGLLGAFALRLWSRSANSAQWRWFAGTVGACAVAALANPAGINGLLYPFHIFENYGYDISENLSLSGVNDRHLWSWPYDLYLALLGLAAAVCLWRWFASKPGTKPLPGTKPFWPQALLLAVLGLGGVAMVRNQPLFSLLMAPIVAELIANRLGPKWGMSGSPKWLAIAGCGLGALLILAEVQERNASGLGLKPGVNNAADFLRTNSISGPVFNDFDIGGYLIYNLFNPAGGGQVFVDGRPEAYPPGFLQSDYVGALSDSSAWERVDNRYHFNAIVISMQDGFPPIEKFILTRVRDPEWAPVYTDPYSLIFVRRNAQNDAVVRAHLIPREAFR